MEVDTTLQENEQRYRQLIYTLPVAIYSCDANGYINLYNEKAVDLWGVEPIIGKSMWCGSWKIYRPDGSSMPLNECPMAIAIKEGVLVEGEEIIVERPDGERRHIRPHPIPLKDETGKVTGAVNMLI